MSPGPPHVIDVVVPEADRAMYQAPVDGRNTAMSALPSPSNGTWYSLPSANGSGMSPAPPHVTAPWMPFAEGTEYQVPFDGRKTVMSARQSASKSPCAGAH